MRIQHTLSFQFCRKLRRRGASAGIVIGTLALICAFISGPAYGQTYLQSIGVPPWSNDLPVENGWIDAANGILHIEIPLASYPQRGGATETVKLEYDSAIWSYDINTGYSYPPAGSYYPSSCPACGLLNDIGGWQLVVSGASGSVSAGTTEYDCEWDPYGDVTGFDLVYNPWIYTEPNGTTHTFTRVTTAYHYGTPGNCTNFPLNGSSYADADDGYYINVTNGTSATVYAPDGTIISNLDNYLATRTDPNGNQYTCSNCATGDTSEAEYYDTLKRTVAKFTVSSDKNDIYIDVLNDHGGTARYTAHVASVDASFFWGSPIYTISEVDLPDGSSYLFGYDSGTGSDHFGVLDSVTLPTGGTVSYSYSLFGGIGFDNVWVTHRTTPDSSTGWSYVPATAGSGVQTNTVTKPTGEHTVYTMVMGQNLPYTTLAQYYDSASNLVETVSNCYAGLSPQTSTCPDNGTGDGELIGTTTTLPAPGGNISATTEYTWNSNYQGNIVKKSEWNFGSSPTGSADRTTTYTYYTPSVNCSSMGPGCNLVNRPATITVANSSGSLVSKTVNCYDNTSGCGTSLASGHTGVVQHDDTNYGSGFTARGNLTQVQNYTSSSSYITSEKMTYDITGQLTMSYDGNNNETTYSYSDNFYTDNGNTSGLSSYTPSTATNAYLTSKTEAYGTSVAEAFAYGYYWGTGQMALSTDPNSQTTYYHFYDSENRPTATIFPDGGWKLATYPSATELDRYTGITSPTPGTSCPSSGSTCRQDQTEMDSLGRVQHQNLVSDPSGEDSVDTAYDSDGRAYSVSNPHRSGSSPTDGTEYYGYDALDRKYKITRTDGGAAYTYYGATVSSQGGRSSQMCSGYGTGYPVLHVDEAGHKRQNWTDGFGRLIEVDEPDPSSGSLTSGSPANTCYRYDLNNNLTYALSAGGTQSRSLFYDMISRLTSSINPESNWTATGTPTSVTTYYSYDSNANLTSKTEPAQNQQGASTVTISYCYDALNRMIAKEYASSSSCSAPVATYWYDGQTPSGCTISSFSYGSYTKPNRTAMCDAAGTEAWSYDKMGRVLNDQRVSNAVTKTATYTYNYDGSITTLLYPSGRTITYTPNSAQQFISAVDVAHSINFATNASYSPQGALTSLSSGSSLVSTTYYNNRLQPCRISAKSSGTAPTSCADATDIGNILDLTFNWDLSSVNSLCSTSFGSPTDNGNLASVANNITTGRSQNFCYDPLNRLAKAETTSTYSTGAAYCWGESYTIDALGNLKGITPITGVYSGCTVESGISVSANAQNRIYAGTNPDFSYDTAGNMINDTTHSYTFDAENHLTQVDGTPGNCSSATECYVYDGDGRRVEKETSSVSKIYWYDQNGSVLDETDGSGNTSNSSFNEYIFFNGNRIARLDSSANVYYYFADHLGTTRVITNASGSICYDSDLYPFGVERPPYTQSCTFNTYKFTGKERDSETGLENFGARYDASTMGRFVSPDAMGAAWSQEDPQSFNLYSYVENNPASLTDPSGRVFCRTDPDTQQLICDVTNIEYLNDPAKYDALGYHHYDCSCDTAADILAWNRHIDPGVPDISTDFLNLYFAGSAIRGGFTLARGAWGLLGEFGAANVPEDILVIGKMADLEADGAILPGEKTLLPDLTTDLGSKDANWARNEAKLQDAMKEGQPIRDASVDPATGEPKAGSESGFLGMERDTLRNNGWWLDGDMWNPPQLQPAGYK